MSKPQLLNPDLYTFSLYENQSFIIVSAETEYISTILLSMLHNTFIKCKNYYNWEQYRKQRNHVNKIKKKQSIKTYFYERCLGGPKSSDFWPTIKPFLKSIP
jgi:nicotinamide riboside transporter PnuC